MSQYKYVKAFSLGLQNGMQYRTDFFLRLLSCAFPIIIQLCMWGSIYGEDQNSVIFGYTYSQMITYSIMASIIGRLVRAGFEYDINNDIKNGGLNKYIVRPISYFPYRLSCFMGEKIIQLGFMAVLIALIMLLLKTSINYTLDPGNVTLFVLSLLLAFVLNFMIFFCVSLTSFWLTEIGFFFEAVYIVFLAFSGGIFPLDIFSGTFLSILQYLPFKYTVNFPVDLLNGRLPDSDIPVGFLVQIFWILLLAIATTLLWKAGTKKYIAAGG